MAWAIRSRNSDRYLTAESISNIGKYIAIKVRVLPPLLTEASG
jgi:hypothetical protein